MTPDLQPGLHLDADQLCAFLEDALPPGERQWTIAHLALCPDCRAVAALALPEEPSAVQERPAVSPPPAEQGRPVAWWQRGRRLPWAGWQIALPAAAFALLLAFVAAGRMRTQPAAPVTTSQAAPAPAVQAPPAIAAAVSPAPQRPAAPHPPARIEPHRPMPSDPPRTAPVPPAPGRPAGQLQTAAAAGGTGRAATAADARSLPPHDAAPQSEVTVEASSDVSLSAKPQTPGRVIGQQAAAASARTPTPTAYRLPSGRPLLSSVAAAGRVVAIDARHSVFTSSDGGRTWSAVSTSWAGHPLRVDALTAPDVPHAMALRMPSAASPAAGARSAMSAAPPAVISASVSAGTGGAAAGGLSGSVADTSGAVIPGARVTVTAAGAPPRTAVCDRDGRFTLPGLPAGVYQLHAQANGFREAAIPAEVKPGAVGSVDLHLTVGSTSQNVTVDAETLTINAAPPPIPALTLSQPRAGAEPLFTLLTDTGVRWVSADGAHWIRQ